MERYIDLQIHSVYSDGLLSGAQIIAKAKKYKISVLSLTDHNTIDGYYELAVLGRKNNIKIIPGLELYTHYHGKGLHLLGYNFDLKNEILNDILAQSQKEQRENLRKSIHNLHKMGFVMDEQKILRSQSKFPSVLHLLQEMERHPQNVMKMKMDLGKNYSFFNKIFHYFSKGKAAYLSLPRSEIKEAIKLIKQAGGIPVLAHPGQQLTFEQDYIINELTKAGLEGLEVISPYHNWRQIEHYQRMAQRLKLAITGGTDFHYDIDFTGKELVKNQWDYFRVPYNVYLNFKKYLK